jgi:hypothetical protein
MYSSTHTLGPNPAVDGCLARVTETRTSNPGARVLRARAGVERGPDPERATNEHADPHSQSKRIHWRLGEHVEYALFAVTLAAIGYLEALALLADAM